MCLPVWVYNGKHWVVKICIQLVISTMGGRNEEKLNISRPLWLVHSRK